MEAQKFGTLNCLNNKTTDMKNIKNIGIISMLALLVGFTIFSCQEDDATFGSVIAPSNLSINAQIVGVDAMNPDGDGSGLVNFTISGDNVISYNFQYGDGISESVPSGQITHRYSITGTNTYTVIVNAVGTGGVSSSTSLEIVVFSSFDDQEAKDFLSGGQGLSKTWYLDAAAAGHLGVGPTLLSGDPAAPEAYWYPAYFAAQPFEKCGPVISDCLCDDELTFSLDANNQLTFELNNNGQTFFNASHQDVVAGSGSEDECFDFDSSGVSMVSLSPSDALANLPDPNFEARGTLMNFNPANFMGYYVSSSAYEIISVTNTELYVRTLDGLNQDLAWYHKFSSSPPDNGFTSDYNNLVWEDAFDTNGAPNSSNWTYDLGAGGWGNQELQTYTNNAENVIVEDGLLKITAKANGGGYTSTRLKSENLFEFTYGRVEVRAKLPEGVGTWPAIWMLGEDYETNTWPGCGEIDIMEHVGRTLNEVLGTLHYPGVSPGGGNSNSTIVNNATTEFHNYTVEWSPIAIKFVIDDTVFHTFANTGDTPFNSDFFLILNIAMGGTLGGDVDPGFTESSMEIDYVKVFQ